MKLEPFPSLLSLNDQVTSMPAAFMNPKNLDGVARREKVEPTNYCLKDYGL